MRLGSRGDQRLRRLGFLLRGIRSCRRVAPAREDHPRFGHADAIGKLSIALCLPRLALQCSRARFLVADHFVEPGQVRLGRAQFLLGILAAHMEARDAGGFLQHRAALGGLCRDDRSDPSLAHQRGGVRPRRCIGEDQAHILGAHVAAVDAIGRARAALDPADDFELVLAAHLLGQDRYFGEIARGPRRGSGEDHVFHPRAAHRLGRVLAHRPA